MLRRVTVETPLGPFMVVSGDTGVVRTRFHDDDPDVEDDLEREAAADRRRTAPIRREVEAYFGGRLRTFETPADLSEVGDGFARRVLEMVRTIPYGELWTYGDVAAAAGAKRAGRAAGSALARCPIELFVPCHRVVRAGPSLGSYGRQPERRGVTLRLAGALRNGPVTTCAGSEEYR